MFISPNEVILIFSELNISPSTKISGFGNSNILPTNPYQVVPHFLDIDKWKRIGLTWGLQLNLKIKHLRFKVD